MFRYHLRLQLPPTLNFEERLENMLDFCQKAKVDEVMFFIGCEELSVGHITIEEAKPYVSVIQKAGAYLKELGITVSLNPWMTLGHYDGARSLKDGQNFRRMVGHDGSQAEVVVCPLCAQWREYYVELMNFYVEALKPDILWFEDDFRLHGHGAKQTIKQGCFCEEHMRLYNERLGTSYSRETFVDKIGKDELVRKAYLDVSRQTMSDTLAYVAEHVKEQKRFGLMTGSAYLEEARIYPDFFDSLASSGRKKPYNRLSPSVARQLSPQQTGRFLHTGALLNRYLTGDKAYCVTEIENNPHTMYTKSVRFNKFQQLNAIPLLLSGTTFSIFEFNGNGAINYDRLAKMYAEIKPYLMRVADLELSPFDMTGVNVLVNEDVAYKAKVLSGDYIGDFVDTTGDFMAWFELLGVNCRYNKNVNLKGEVVAIDGQVLRSLSKRQIQELFANNFVIINGDGVEALFDMGLNELIDAKAYELCIERKSTHTFEEINSEEKLQGITQMRATSNFSSGNYLKIAYGNKEKTVLTNIMDCYQKVFGCGMTVIGNVLVEPHKTLAESAAPMPYALYHPLREYAVKAAIQQSGFMKKQTFFVQEENVAPYSFEKDGQVVLMCVNYSDDDYETLHFETDYEFKECQLITPQRPDGYTPKFRQDGKGYVIEETLKGMESWVLILK